MYQLGMKACPCATKKFLNFSLKEEWVPTPPSPPSSPTYIYWWQLFLFL